MQFCIARKAGKHCCCCQIAVERGGEEDSLLCFLPELIHVPRLNLDLKYACMRMECTHPCKLRFMISSANAELIFPNLRRLVKFKSQLPSARFLFRESAPPEPLFKFSRHNFSNLPLYVFRETAPTTKFGHVRGYTVIKR